MLCCGAYGTEGGAGIPVTKGGFELKWGGKEVGNGGRRLDEGLDVNPLYSCCNLFPILAQVLWNACDCIVSAV
jgi:hypothetical protein